MKPGQVVTKWWQDLCAGRLKTPQDLYRAALSEVPPGLASERFLLDEIPEPVGFVAPQTLRAERHFLSNGFLNQWEIADWQFVDRRLLYWSSLFQELARKRGIPLYVHSAFRSKDQQDALVARGVSRSRWPTSAHNRGAAVDIVHGTLHWQMNRQEWAFLHRLGREAERRVNLQLYAPGSVDYRGSPRPREHIKLSLEWGGDWSFYDPAHWQIAGFKAFDTPSSSAPIRRTPRGILRAGLML